MSERARPLSTVARPSAPPVDHAGLRRGGPDVGPRSAAGSARDAGASEDARGGERRRPERRIHGDVLRSALPLPRWSATLPAALERRFAREWASHEGPRLAVTSVIGTLTFLAMTAADSAIAPWVAGAIGALRWSVVAFTSLSSLARVIVLTRHWTVPPSLWSVTNAIGASGMGLYIVVMVRAAPTDVEVVKSSAGLLILLYIGLVARLPFLWCVGTGGIFIAAYAIGVHPVAASAARVVVSNLALFAVSFIFTLAVRWSLDRGQRSAWVLRELDVLRREELESSTEALRQLGLRDQLTGLGNRRRLEAVVDELHDRRLTVFAVDIDDFKAYNDTYGHPAGDACLTAVAHALQGVATAQGGLATRTGGEEFVIVVPPAGAGSDAQVAAALCAAVRELRIPHEASRCRDVVTVSVGAAGLGRGESGAPAEPDPACDGLQVAVVAADHALYAAKEAGRDRWVIATAAQVEAARAAVPARRAAVDPAHPSDAGVAGVPGYEATTGSTVGAGGRRRRDRRGHAPMPDPGALDDLRESSPSFGQKRLSVLTVGFTPVALVLSIGNATLYPDVGTAVMWAVAVLAVLGTLWSLVALTLRVPWRVRVRSVEVLTGLLGLILLVAVATSSAPLAVIAAACLVLVPMFLAFVVGAPVVDVAAMSVLLGAGLLVVTRPWSPAATALGTGVTTVQLVAIAFVLLGAYRLQRTRTTEFALTLSERELRRALTAQEAELELVATTDPLTGLTNRRGWESHLPQVFGDALTRRQPVAMALVDVDHFKRLNDSAGHDAGDQVLRRLGAALAAWAASACAAADPTLPAVSAARWGGEEFVVLLPGRYLDDALCSLEELRQVIAGLQLAHPSSPVGRYVSVSIGVAVTTPAGMDSDGRSGHDHADPRAQCWGHESLLAAADAALYRAKSGGRDRIAT